MNEIPLSLEERGIEDSTLLPEEIYGLYRIDTTKESHPCYILESMLTSDGWVPPVHVPDFEMLKDDTRNSSMDQLEAFKSRSFASDIEVTDPRSLRKEVTNNQIIFQTTSTPVIAKYSTDIISEMDYWIPDTDYRTMAQYIGPVIASVAQNEKEPDRERLKHILTDKWGVNELTFESVIGYLSD